VVAALVAGCADDDRDSEGRPWEPDEGAEEDGSGDPADPDDGEPQDPDDGSDGGSGGDGETGGDDDTPGDDGTGGGDGDTGGGDGDSGGGDGDTGGGDDTGTEGGTEGDGDPDTVCYPGEDESWTTCLPIYPAAPYPPGYDYPPPLGGNPNYRPPIAFLDLEELDPETYLSPNFRLDEVAQLYKGRWAVVQPHAIVALQDIRDELGSLTLNSGYRSPEYNASVGGVTNSRHMFGDAFDIAPGNASLSQLEQACEDYGGFLVEYDTFAHCDWRLDPVDEQFFGAPMGYGPWDETAPMPPEERDL
jgi:hypothetical protein